MYTQSHILTVLQGGGLAFMEPLPWVFDMLQILPSYWKAFHLLNKMSYSAAGGLWRPQKWSPSGPPCWIYPELEIS